MKIREYVASDMPKLTALIYKTVHAISDQYYTEEQREGWAPQEIEKSNLSLKYTLVCTENEDVVGFIDFDDRNGFINYLYTDPEYQDKGVASELYEKIEQKARELKLDRISARASKTALDFFLKRGFDIRWENEVIRRGVLMINYTMNKNL